MLKKLVSQWDRNKGKLRDRIMTDSNVNGEDYLYFVKIAFDEIVNRDLQYDVLNVCNIHEIDDGEYQGTQIYLIPANTYQPSVFDYLATSVCYGSCSGCDTLQSIRAFNTNEEPTKEQVDDYMALCKDIITSAFKLAPGGYKLQEYDEVAVVEP